MSTGVELIAAERQRQIKVEGYDADHDVGHADELSIAAACYALPAESRKIKIHHLSGLIELRVQLWRLLWPWDERWWKPIPDDRIRELVKAGGLIAAAIDALSESKAESSHPEPNPCGYRCLFSEAEHATNDRIRHPFIATPSQPDLTLCFEPGCTLPGHVSREPGLDAAWREAEAALPDGWDIAWLGHSGHTGRDGGRDWTAQAQGPKRSQTVYADQNKPTPDAALRSLASKLRERAETDR